jgi:hypothetical protein
MDFFNKMPSIGPMSAEMEEILIVLAAIILVTLIIVIWILYFRKPQRHEHHHHKTGHREHSKEISDEGKMRVRKHYRQRRRERRPMNPTLAQTGGLPPIRSQTPLDPPKSQTP